jgi:hypothetical protein
MFRSDRRVPTRLRTCCRIRRKSSDPEPTPPSRAGTIRPPSPDRGGPVATWRKPRAASRKEQTGRSSRCALGCRRHRGRRRTRLPDSPETSKRPPAMTPHPFLGGVETGVALCLAQNRLQRAGLVGGAAWLRGIIALGAMRFQLWVGECPLTYCGGPLSPGRDLGEIARSRRPAGRAKLPSRSARGSVIRGNGQRMAPFLPCFPSRPLRWPL